MLMNFNIATKQNTFTKIKKQIIKNEINKTSFYIGYVSSCFK
jgi:hypothetical protein